MQQRFCWGPLLHEDYHGLGQSYDYYEDCQGMSMLLLYQGLAGTWLTLGNTDSRDLDKHDICDCVDLLRTEVLALIAFRLSYYSSTQYLKLFFSLLTPQLLMSYFSSLTVASIRTYHPSFSGAVAEKSVRTLCHCPQTCSLCR